MSDEQQSYLSHQQEMGQLYRNEQNVDELTMMETQLGTYFAQTAIALSYLSRHDEIEAVKTNEDGEVLFPKAVPYSDKGFYVENADAESYPLYHNFKESFLTKPGVTDVYVVGPSGAGKGLITSQFFELFQHDKEIMDYVHEGKGDLLYLSLAKSYDYLIHKDYLPPEWKSAPERVAANEVFMQTVRDEVHEKYKHTSALFLFEMVGALPSLGEAVIQKAIAEDTTGQVFIAGVSPTVEVQEAAKEQRRDLKAAAATGEPADAVAAFVDSDVTLHTTKPVTTSEDVEALVHSSGDDVIVDAIREAFITRMAHEMHGELGGNYQTAEDFAEALRTNGEIYTQVVAAFLEKWATKTMGIDKSRLFVEYNHYEDDKEKHLFHDHLQTYFMPKEILDAAFEKFYAAHPNLDEFIPKDLPAAAETDIHSSEEPQGTIYMDQVNGGPSVTP